MHGVKQVWENDRSMVIQKMPCPQTLFLLTTNLYHRLQREDIEPSIASLHQLPDERCPKSNIADLLTHEVVLLCYGLELKLSVTLNMTLEPL